MSLAAPLFLPVGSVGVRDGWSYRVRKLPDDAPSDNEQPWDDEDWSAPGAGDGEEDFDED